MTTETLKPRIEIELVSSAALAEQDWRAIKSWLALRYSVGFSNSAPPPRDTLAFFRSQTLENERELDQLIEDLGAAVRASGYLPDSVHTIQARYLQGNSNHPEKPWQRSLPLQSGT